MLGKPDYLPPYPSSQSEIIPKSEALFDYYCTDYVTEGSSKRLLLTRILLIFLVKDGGDYFINFFQRVVAIQNVGEENVNK